MPEIDKNNNVDLIKSIYQEYQFEFRMFVALLILGFILSLISPYFFTINNIMNLMDQAVVIGIVAIGELLVILTGGIDLSVGSVLGFSGIVMGLVAHSIGGPLGIIVGLICGLLMGMLTGLFISWGKIPPFVATLGVMSIGRSLAYVLSGANSITNLPGVFTYFGNTYIFDIIPLNFTILIILYIGVLFILKKTKPGRIIYGIGSNEEAVKYSGILTKYYKIIVYSSAGLLSAFASLMLASRILSIDPMAGNGMELDAIAAVVIGGASLSGGKGSIIGTLIGVFIVGVIRNGLNLLGVTPYWQGTAIGLLIIGAVLGESLIRKRSKN